MNTPTLLSRIQRGIAAFNSRPVDFKAASIALDKAIKDGTLPTGPVVEKAADPASRLPDSKMAVRSSTQDLALAYTGLYSMLRGWLNRDGTLRKEIPPRGDPSRDYFMAMAWMDEPILAGAIYSMCAKMSSLKWTVTGKRSLAMAQAKMLARAAFMGGYDWGGFISSVAQDFYTVNRGVFIETAKDGDPMISPMTDLGHIDALCCTLTGNITRPMVYVSEELGQRVAFQMGEYIHFASMPSPRERFLGAGLCAVDRCFRAAQLLLGLHDYDTEKLNNLPPEGVATVTGLTMDEFNDAVKLWKSGREQDKSLTFPQVLWLIGSQPNVSVDVKLVPFSTLPEQFNREVVVDQYVNTLALCFGVDAREFWSMKSGGGLGSAGESEIQHLKAKGKGPGEFISTLERHINGEFPEGVDFSVDEQDLEENANSAAVAKAWISAFLPLYNLPKIGGQLATEAQHGNTSELLKANPQPDKPNKEPNLPTSPLPKVNTGQATMGEGMGKAQSPTAEQVITKDELLRLLADKGVIPDWMVNDSRETVGDSAIHNFVFKSEGHPDDVSTFTWDKGVLKEHRAKAIVINSTVPALDAEVVEAEYHELPNFKSIQAALEYLRCKEDEILAAKRNIRGNPIPENEVTRGSAINAKTLREELERWHNDPILSQYALSPEQEQKLLGIGQ